MIVLAALLTIASGLQLGAEVPYVQRVITIPAEHADWPQAEAARALGLPDLTAVKLGSGVREIRIGDMWPSGETRSPVLRLVDFGDGEVFGELIWVRPLASGDCGGAGGGTTCAEVARFSEEPDWSRVTRDLEGMEAWSIFQRCDSPLDPPQTSPTSALDIRTLAGTVYSSYLCVAPSGRTEREAGRVAARIYEYFLALAGSAIPPGQK